MIALFTILQNNYLKSDFCLQSSSTFATEYFTNLREVSSFFFFFCQNVTNIFPQSQIKLKRRKKKFPSRSAERN